MKGFYEGMRIARKSVLLETGVGVVEYFGGFFHHFFQVLRRHLPTFLLHLQDQFQRFPGLVRPEFVYHVMNVDELKYTITVHC